MFYGLPFKKERALSMSRTKTTTFNLDEEVVYPGHGVAKISRIIEKKVAGHNISFFELKFLNKDMTILVPTQNLSSVGIRRLSSSEYIQSIFTLLKQPSQKLSSEVITNWNKRNKDYQSKLRSGDLQEICKIYRDLKNMSVYKELSFGEKTLLQQTELLLAQEISLVQNVNEEQAIENLRKVFKKTVSKGVNQVATML